jgi:hypothetical protein
MLTEWVKFACIVLITAIDHVLHEIAVSFNTTRDFVRYRLKWIVRDKLRTLWAGRQR